MTSATKNILIVSGDVSGDLHASGLIKELKKQDPAVRVTAIGGKRMQEQADVFLYDLAAQGAHGFIEPIKKTPLWLDLIKQIRTFMDTQNPAAVIVVDFYGFNNQVLKLAAKRHIPAYYYVTPQVWASRRYRAKRLAKLTRKMYVIYPFEPAFHKNFGGNAVFLGNPLLDITPAPQPHTYETESPQAKAWKLGILPGSRPSEIRRLGPVFYQAFLQILKEFPHTQAYWFLLPEADENAVKELLGGEVHPHLHFVKDKNHEVRGQMDFLLACSGTATLENALLGVPMVVAYKLFWPTYAIARLIIKVNYISLVNLLADKPLVKELIQGAATADALAQQTLDMFRHPAKLAAQREELLKLRASLGEPGVAARAAADILTDIKSN